MDDSDFRQIVDLQEGRNPGPRLRVALEEKRRPPERVKAESAQGDQFVVPLPVSVEQDAGRGQKSFVVILYLRHQSTAAGGVRHVGQRDAQDLAGPFGG